jgi:hypothetical protein
MPRSSWPAFLFIAQAALGGCHKSPAPALGGFGDQAAAVVCDKVYECCMPMEVMDNMNYSGGRDECGRKTAGALGFWAAVIEQEQGRGRLIYDASISQHCLATFRAATCDMHKRNAPLEGCDTFIVPRTPPGSPCQANESCMDGACVGVTAQSEGVCHAFVGEGASCAIEPCAKGLHCDGANKTCVSNFADGTTCNLNSDCASQGCNGRNPDAGTPGTCGLKGGENTTCFVTTGCAMGGRAPGAGGGGGALVALGLALWARRRRRAT